MRTHISLPTAKLDESVAFYRTLLNAEPRKHYSDYALFVLDNPGLELTLQRGEGSHASGTSHFGIAVEASESVEAAIERLTQSKLAVDVERDEECCYARQTKVWATDPDGRRWEVYYVIEESEEPQDGDSQCCATDCCAA